LVFWAALCPDDVGNRLDHLLDVSQKFRGWGDSHRFDIVIYMPDFAHAHQRTGNVVMLLGKLHRQISDVYPSISTVTGYPLPNIKSSSGGWMPIRRTFLGRHTRMQR
jgi:hypothetical protein